MSNATSNAAATTAAINAAINAACCDSGAVPAVLAEPPAPTSDAPATCTPAVVDLLPMPEDETERDALLAGYAKALGHPARVAILRLLIKQQACICGQIVDQLPLAQSTVSQHLKVLKKAGLIRGTIDGPRICYCVDPAALSLFRSLLATL